MKALACGSGAPGDTPISHSTSRAEAARLAAAAQGRTKPSPLWNSSFASHGPSSSEVQRMGVPFRTLSAALASDPSENSHSSRWCQWASIGPDGTRLGTMAFPFAEQLLDDGAIAVGGTERTSMKVSSWHSAGAFS
jgi:hypothetical protein